MIRLLIALTSCFLVLTTQAVAADWLPVFTRTSEQYWAGGQLPPCGTPIFQWVDGATLTQEHGFETLADANPANCVIRFNVDAWHVEGTPLRCVIVAHELGHLYGHDHNDNPDSIMYGGGVAPLALEWWTVPPCRAAIRRVAHRVQHRYIWRGFVPR